MGQVLKVKFYLKAFLRGFDFNSYEYLRRNMEVTYEGKAFRMGYVDEGKKHSFNW